MRCPRATHVSDLVAEFGGTNWKSRKTHASGRRAEASTHDDWEQRALAAAWTAQRSLTLCRAGQATTPSGE